jgi:tRNA G18 (ribose-2'-O)-methylase SpoU
MKRIILIAHNLRSAHNIGSLLRTADAMGVYKVYLTGYSPYPQSENDSRLPHLALKIEKNIAKTALGAEKNIDWEHADTIDDVINLLKNDGFTISALEQHQNSLSLPKSHIFYCHQIYLLTIYYFD